MQGAAAASSVSPMSPARRRHGHGHLAGVGGDRRRQVDLLGGRLPVRGVVAGDPGRGSGVAGGVVGVVVAGAAGEGEGGDEGEAGRGARACARCVGERRSAVAAAGGHRPPRPGRRRCRPRASSTRLTAAQTWLGTTSTRLPSGGQRRAGEVDDARGARTAARPARRGGRAAGRSRWRTAPGRRRAPCCPRRATIRPPAWLTTVARHVSAIRSGVVDPSSHCWASPKTYTPGRSSVRTPVSESARLGVDPPLTTSGSIPAARSAADRRRQCLRLVRRGRRATAVRCVAVAGEREDAAHRRGRLGRDRATA